MCVRRALLDLTLLCGCGWSLYVVVQGALLRVPLCRQLGVGYWLIMTAIAVGVALLLFALLRLRQTPPTLAPLRLLFELLTFAAILFVAFLQPFGKVYFDLTLALVFAAYGFALTLGPCLVRRVPRPVMRSLDIICFNVCLLLVAGEVALRVFAMLRPSPLFAQVDQEVQQRIDALRHPQGQLRYGFPCNSSGHYDEEFSPRSDGPPLAVAIGDSFSDGVVPHHFHFTTVAERELGRGRRIANMGFPSSGPNEYLYLLRYEAKPLDPDVIAVNLFLGNDITQAREARRGNRTLRRWFDRQNVLLVTVPHRLFILSEERRRSGRGEGPVYELQGERDSQELRLETVAELEQAFPWLLNWRDEKPTVSRESFLETEAARAYGECGVETSHYAALYAQLWEMKLAAGATPFVVVLIPDEFQVEDALWNEVRDVLVGKSLDRDQPQRLLGAWLSEQEIPHLDLLPILRAAPTEEDGDRHCYHQHNTHFNARGNRVAGEALAQFLEPYLKG